MVSQKMQTRFTGHNILIRRAVNEDISALVKICRSSFQESLRWQGPGFGAQSWWQFMINCPHCETWVLLDAEKIAGFIVPILDVNQYNKDKLISGK